MNQQMHLLEARAVARDREHQLQLNQLSGARPSWARHVSARRLSLSLLGRRHAAQDDSSRSAYVATARG